MSSSAHTAAAGLKPARTICTLARASPSTRVTADHSRDPDDEREP